jgi:uncharacterized protein YsxB (DUF464 family)
MTDNNDKDPIGKALGLPFVPMPSQVNDIIAEAHNDSAKNDFEVARANILTMLETSQDAIEKLADISTQSQNPRAFEVLAKLIETTVKANESLLALQSKIREIQNIESPMNDQARTINNNLFIGSTSELQKMLKEIRNEQPDQDI